MKRIVSRKRVPTHTGRNSELYFVELKTILKEWPMPHGSFRGLQKFLPVVHLQDCCGGDSGTRIRGLCLAKATLCQLSYIPMCKPCQRQPTRLIYLSTPSGSCKLRAATPASCLSHPHYWTCSHLQMLMLCSNLGPPWQVLPVPTKTTDT